MKKHSTYLAIALSALSLTACDTTLEKPAQLGANTSAQDVTACGTNRDFAFFDACPAVPTTPMEAQWLLTTGSGPSGTLTTSGVIELYGFGPTYYYANGNAEIGYPSGGYGFVRFPIPCFLETGGFRMRVKANNGGSLKFAQTDTLGGNFFVNNGVPMTVPTHSSIIVDPVRSMGVSTRHLSWDPALFGKSTDQVRITLRQVTTSPTDFQFKYYTFSSGNSVNFPNTGSATLDLSTLPLPLSGSYNVYIDRPLTTTAYRSDKDAFSYCILCVNPG